jgi:tetratricopeptide (TPR) repeat protein
VAAKIKAARERVLAARDDAEAWARFGMVLQAHHVAEAEGAYLQALALHDDAHWHHYLAKVIEADQPETALTHATAAVRLAPDYVPARVEKAYLLEQTGRLDEAIRELEEARRMDASSVATLFTLGRLLLAKGDAAGSIEPLQQAVARNPGLGSAHGLLARAYRLTGDAAAAKREADLAKPSSIGLPTQDPWMEEVDAEAVSLLGYLAKAKRAELAGDLSQAESIYRHALDIRPQDADVHFVLGQLYLRHGRPADAAAAYEQTLHLQPQHFMAHLRLGQLAENGGDLTTAIGHYRAAVEASPELPMLHEALAAALGQSGDAKGAQSESAEAARLGGSKSSR